jgi:hypothetical protein
MLCTSTQQCLNIVANSQCVGDQCQCPVDYQLDSTQVNCVATSCQRGATCHTTACCQLADKNTICDVTSTTGGVGTCACVANYVPSIDGRHCAKQYHIGDSCSAADQCSSVMAGSTCSPSTGQCACVTGYQALDDLSGCTKLPLFQVFTYHR